MRKKQQYVIIFGTYLDGVSIIGPFKTFAAAEKWGKKVFEGPEFEVMELDPPKKWEA